MKFLNRLNPFGRHNNLELRESTVIQIERLIVQTPETWEAIKDVACSMMNRDAKKMVKDKDSGRDKMANRIEALDDFLKECLTIKGKRYDNVVDLNGHLPVLQKNKNEESDQGEKEMLRATGKKKNIFHYIMSEDIRNASWKKKLTNRRED